MVGVDENIKYCSADEVFKYLKITDYDTADTDLMDNIIVWVSNEIDELAGCSWGVRESDEELHSAGRTVIFSLWILGVPIYTKYYPIKELISLKVWNGSSYEEWIGSKQEGRTKDYWVDYERGIIYLNNWFLRTGGYEVKVKYKYGYGYVDNNGNVVCTPEAKVKRLAILMSAREFMLSERYQIRVPEGVGEWNVSSQIQMIEREIEKLRDWLSSLRVITGGISL